MKKVKYSTIIFYLIVIIFLIYFGTFAFLNMARYVQNVDSDLGAEALYMKELWDSKSLFPPTWHTSTETKFVSTALIGSGIYGVTKNMQSSIGVACIIVSMIIMYGFYFMLKKAGLSRLGRVTGLLLLCGFATGGLKVGGQQVPYFLYLIFLFAGYYAPYIGFIFYSLGVYFEIMDGRISKTKYCSLIFLLTFFSFTMGCSGIRALENIIVPYIILELIRLYRISNRLTVKPANNHFATTYYIFFMLIGNILGLAMPHEVTTKITLLSPFEIGNKLLSMVGDILYFLGISGGKEVTSLAGILQLLVYCFIGFSIYGIVVIKKEYRNIEIKNEKDCKEKQDSINKQIFMLIFYITTFLLTVFVVAVTDTYSSYNYYYGALLFVIVSMAVLSDCLGRNSKVLHILIYFFVIVYCLLNFKITYLNTIRNVGNNNEFVEIAEWMEENQIKMGYATFWNANKITTISNGKVTVASVKDITEPKAYLWLTDEKWYIPYQDENTPVVFIVEQKYKDDFEKKVVDNKDVTWSFSAGEFNIYTSKYNHVGLPSEEND